MFRETPSYVELACVVDSPAVSGLGAVRRGVIEKQKNAPHKEGQSNRD